MLKKINGGWLVDIQPAGRGGKRFRKKFTNQAEAKNWEAWTKTQVIKASEWEPEKKESRKLSKLIELWYKHHGHGLNSGIDTKNRLLNLAKAINDPVSDQFKSEDFAVYRSERIASGISQNNINREHSYLRAVFNELKRLGLWNKENPLQNLRQFKIQQQELTSLSKKQIEEIFKAIKTSQNTHVELITKICLSTGARWSEAEGLTRKQLKNEMIEFSNTKSKRTRAIPISNKLEKEIRDHGKEGEEKFFTSSMGAFHKVLERAKIDLPKGQATHVLRHTFASYFMQNGGNILTLQKILGHSNLTMTMRYAHMAPDHLEEAKKLNPLAKLG